MNQKSILRLGQVSRKLNVGRNTIIDFLQNRKIRNNIVLDIFLIKKLVMNHH